MKAWFEALSKETQKQIRVAILTTLVFLLSILTYLPFGEDLENLSYDILTEYVKTAKNEAPDERVELILIDEDAMVFGQAIKLGRWPWPRKIYPYILNFLNKDISDHHYNKDSYHNIIVKAITDKKLI